MDTKTIVATAAAAFAVATFATSASAVVCKGANACKGQSACKGASNACKGQNACKGKGFVDHDHVPGMHRPQVALIVV